VAWFVLAATTRPVAGKRCKIGARLAGPLGLRTCSDRSDRGPATLATLGLTVAQATIAAVAIGAAARPSHELSVTVATIPVGGLGAAWLLRSSRS
jgi:hypothetical protein